MSTITSISPIDGSKIGDVSETTDVQYEKVISQAQSTFEKWRMVPAPVRGNLVREISDAIRAQKKELGELVSREMGKIRSEGEGEIQEIIDICDFAVGLSRQLCGQTMHSERPMHRMYEQWHPLGIVGVITAFNFPAAVWGWNAMLAAVCGDVVVWKPSEFTPVTAVKVNELCSSIAARHGYPHLFQLIQGSGASLGAKLAADGRVPLISATGSCRMGRAVADVVGKRLGRTILELGGNNALIVLDDADLKLALSATLFGAVGTAGQRCTTTRRLLVQNGIQKTFTEKLVAAYKKIKIGNPLESGILMGPLIHEAAVKQFEKAIFAAKSQGGEVLCGGEVLKGMASTCYVQPTIIRANRKMAIVKEETFAPILYIIPVADVQEAIAVNNEVDQGLSSAIYTKNLQHAEQFISHCGSDCGIANVNIGTSGAEIGGAFGGEKDTGGGRESGSDSWKQYMRRQTNTINWSDALPLAQGVSFDV